MRSPRSRPFGSTRLPDLSGCTCTPTRAWSGSASSSARRAVGLHPRVSGAALSGQDPLGSTGARARCSTPTSGSPAAAPRCAASPRSTSRSGTSSARSPASRSTSCWRGWSRARFAPTTPAPVIATCAPPAARHRRTGVCDGNAGPYEDLDAFLHRADELAHSAAGAGHHRHEDLAVRSAAEAAADSTSPRRSGAGAGTVPQDPLGGRHTHGHHGRVPLALESARRRRAIAQALEEFEPSGTRTRSAWTCARWPSYAASTPGADRRERDLGDALALPGGARDAAPPAS